MFCTTFDHSKEDPGLLYGDRFSKLTLNTKFLVRARLFAYGGGESVPLNQRISPWDMRKEIGDKCIVFPLQGGPAELPTDSGRKIHHGSLPATEGMKKQVKSNQVFLTVFFFFSFSFLFFIPCSNGIGCN